jgi:putative addiction module killer protein
MQATPRKVINYTLPDGREPLKEWLYAMKDYNGQDKIIRRLERIEQGNLGKTRRVGEGVLELKINVGPGYRVYVGLDGQLLVVLLCGGDKHTQERKDIETSRLYWADYKSRKG